MVGRCPRIWSFVLFIWAAAGAELPIIDISVLMDPQIDVSSAAAQPTVQVWLFRVYIASRSEWYRITNQAIRFRRLGRLAKNPGSFT